MPAELPGMHEPQHGQRLASAVLPVALALMVLLILSSGRAAWAGPTATVPRETPTRQATSTVPATETPVLTLSPTPPPTAAAQLTPTPGTTAAPGQPTATTAPAPTAVPTPSPTAAQTPVQPTPVLTSTHAPQAPTATGVPGSATPLASPTLGVQLSPTLPPSQTAAAVASPTRPALASPAGGACGDGARTIRWPDGRAVVDVPAESMTTVACIYLDALDVSALPAAPAGFRLSAPTARLRATDASGAALTGFAFAQAVSLSLRFEAGSSAEAGFTSAVVGFLGETSTDWAVLETERDTTASMTTAHARRAGIYALLVRLPAPVESKPATSGAWTGLLLPVAGLVVALVIFTILIMRRRR